MSKTCVAAAGLYCGFGLTVPIPATIAGMVAVILVRGILWSKDQNIGWNVAVLGLNMGATFVSIEGHEMSTFVAFWLGIGYGAIGVGVIEIGKNFSAAGIRDRLAKAWAGFTGSPTPPGSKSD